MARRGTQDGADWRQVLRELKHPLAQLPASSQSGQFLNSRGYTRAAEAAYREVLQRDPADRDALEGLAWLMELFGRTEEAATLRRETIVNELTRLGVPAEHLEEAIQFRMAAAGRHATPVRAPPAYVASLFDDYAEHFDAHLTDVLKYRGPQVLAELAAELLGPAAAKQEILDLGCGTGLAGPLLQPLAARLDGIDLSPRMLEKARDRQVYHRLDEGEICTLLATRIAEYDLLVAADVLVYFGDLTPVIKSVAGALRAGGLFVASCEDNSEPGYLLGGTRRYTHHPQFVRDTARDCGLQEICARQEVLRHEQFTPVPSTVYAFRRI